MMQQPKAWGSIAKELRKILISFPWPEGRPLNFAFTQITIAVEALALNPHDAAKQQFINSYQAQASLLKIIHAYGNLEVSAETDYGESYEVLERLFTEIYHIPLPNISSSASASASSTASYMEMSAAPNSSLSIPPPPPVFSAGPIPHSQLSVSQIRSGKEESPFMFILYKAKNGELCIKFHGQNGPSVVKLSSQSKDEAEKQFVENWLGLTPCLYPLSETKKDFLRFYFPSYHAGNGEYAVNFITQARRDHFIKLIKAIPIPNKENKDIVYYSYANSPNIFFTTYRQSITEASQTNTLYFNQRCSIFANDSERYLTIYPDENKATLHQLKADKSEGSVQPTSSTRRGMFRQDKGDLFSLKQQALRSFLNRPLAANHKILLEEHLSNPLTAKPINAIEYSPSHSSLSPSSYPLYSAASASASASMALPTSHFFDEDLLDEDWRESKLYTAAPPPKAPATGGALLHYPYCPYCPGEGRGVRKTAFYEKNKEKYQCLNCQQYFN
jgi:hypothetical protein